MPDESSRSFWARCKDEIGREDGVRWDIVGLSLLVIIGASWASGRLF